MNRIYELSDLNILDQLRDVINGLEGDVQRKNRGHSLLRELRLRVKERKYGLRSDVDR